MRDDEFTEVERYELREPPKYRFAPDRRDFIGVLGAGLIVAASADFAVAQRRRGGRSPRREELLTDRFHFAEDGTVTVLTSKVEVGQGSRTQLTQAAAEELRVPVDSVRLIMADTAIVPDDGGTAGSRTTPSTVPRVRSAAASAREVLAELAARKLGADRAALRMEEGVFSVGDKQLTIADLVKDAQFDDSLQTPHRENATIARVQDWQVLGTSVPKTTGRQVVTGAAEYPSDVVREGMHHGKVLRPSSYGAALESIDLEPARRMENVTVVRDGDFIGCVAPTSWQASKALQAIAETATWSRSPHPSSDELFQVLKDRAGDRTRDNEWGDRQAAFESAKTKWNADYTVSYIQHAPMEPRAAVAEWNEGALTVWTGTQQPARVQRELAGAFRLRPDRVRVIVPDTGGGFGGKHTGEAAVEAARLAKAAGRPVSLRWTRQEEFTWAYFRPAGVIKAEAALDDSGKIVAWDFANYNSGGSAIATPYRVPNGRTRFIPSDSPLRQGSYRALASTANAFARESAMDELAELAGDDPLDFRLKHLDEGRLKDVLQAAAEAFGWAERRAQGKAGRGVGLGCGTEKGSYVAACAEVEVVDGRIKLLSVCQAYECGAIQNPRNLRSQVEGSIIMGIGGALTEKIEFRDGVIVNPDFSSYRVPRMADVPELEVVLLDRKDLPSVGGSETPIIAVAPAIANAVRQAAQVRCRSMPITL